MSRDVFFNGPTGVIEGKINHGFDNKEMIPGNEKSCPSVLILHPDPLSAGTMNNKVVYTLYRAFSNCGFNTLRFNFRGVGKSKGNISDFNKDPDQVGVSDATYALNWLHSEFPSTSHYWVAGFSFGSWIASHLMMRRPEIEGFILVAPPASNKDFHFLNPCPSSGLIIQPEKDEIAKLSSTNSLVESLSSQCIHQIDYNIIQNADHFFQDSEDKSKNYLNELYSVAYDYLSVRLATRVTKPIRKKRRRRKRKETSDDE